MAGDRDELALGDARGAQWHACSVLHCLPVGIADAPRPAESAAIGTVLRPGTLERLVADAGFATITPVDVAHDKWRFWALRP